MSAADSNRFSSDSPLRGAPLHYSRDSGAGDGMGPVAGEQSPEFNSNTMLNRILGESNDTKLPTAATASGVTSLRTSSNKLEAQNHNSPPAAGFPGEGDGLRLRMSEHEEHGDNQQDSSRSQLSSRSLHAAQHLQQLKEELETDERELKEIQTLLHGDACDDEEAERTLRSLLSARDHSGGLMSDRSGNKFSGAMGSTLGGEEPSVVTSTTSAGASNAWWYNDQQRQQYREAMEGHPRRGKKNNNNSSSANNNNSSGGGKRGSTVEAGTLGYNGMSMGATNNDSGITHESIANGVASTSYEEGNRKNRRDSIPKYYYEDPPGKKNMAVDTSYLPPVGERDLGKLSPMNLTREAEKNWKDSEDVLLDDAGPGAVVRTRMDDLTEYTRGRPEEKERIVVKGKRKRPHRTRRGFTLGIGTLGLEERNMNPNQQPNEPMSLIDWTNKNYREEQERRIAKRQEAYRMWRDACLAGSTYQRLNNAKRPDMCEEDLLKFEQARTRAIAREREKKEKAAARKRMELESALLESHHKYKQGEAQNLPPMYYRTAFDTLEEHQVPGMPRDVFGVGVQDHHKAQILQQQKRDGIRVDLEEERREEGNQLRQKLTEQLAQSSKETEEFTKAMRKGTKAEKRLRAMRKSRYSDISDASSQTSWSNNRRGPMRGYSSVDEERNATNANNGSTMGNALMGSRRDETSYNNNSSASAGSGAFTSGNSGAIRPTSGGFTRPCAAAMSTPSEDAQRSANNSNRNRAGDGDEDEDNTFLTTMQGGASKATTRPGSSKTGGRPHSRPNSSGYAAHINTIGAPGATQPGQQATTHLLSEMKQWDAEFQTPNKPLSSAADPVRRQQWLKELEEERQAFNHKTAELQRLSSVKAAQSREAWYEANLKCGEEERLEQLQHAQRREEDEQYQLAYNAEKYNKLRHQSDINHEILIQQQEERREKARAQREIEEQHTREKSASCATELEALRESVHRARAEEY